MFGDHLTKEGVLSHRMAELIWCCVRVAHERNETLMQKWKAAFDELRERDPTQIEFPKGIHGIN
jgi:hypothetical protein